jgi:hypothetical protein
MLEIGSYLIGGSTAKWIAISTIQILKCTWRAIYVVKKKKIFKRQILDETDREKYTKESKTKDENLLSRSGRIMRSIDDEEEYDSK